MPAIGPGAGGTAPSKTNQGLSLEELRVGSSHEPLHVTYGMIHNVCHENKTRGFKGVYLGDPV